MSEASDIKTGLKQEVLFTYILNIALEKAIREMQRETIGVAIDEHHIQVLGFADDLNILRNSLEYTERAAQVLEQAASNIGLKINTEKNKIMKLLGNEENTDRRTLTFEKFNES